MKKTSVATLSALALFVAKASAEDLKSVGILNPLKLTVYADTNSITRRAHFSSINLLVPITPKHADKTPLSFDCEKRRYILPDNTSFPLSTPLRWEKEGVQYSLSDETLPNAFSVACKSKWEFWKK